MINVDDYFMAYYRPQAYNDFPGMILRVVGIDPLTVQPVSVDSKDFSYRGKENTEYHITDIPYGAKWGRPIPEIVVFENNNPNMRLILPENTKFPNQQDLPNGEIKWIRKIKKDDAIIVDPKGFVVKEDGTLDKDPMPSDIYVVEVEKGWNEPYQYFAKKEGNKLILLSFDLKLSNRGRFGTYKEYSAMPSSEVRSPYTEILIKDGKLSKGNIGGRKILGARRWDGETPIIWSEDTSD